MGAPMLGDVRLEVALLKKEMPKAVLAVKEYRGDTYVCVERSQIREVIRFLRDHPELEYDYFCECVGVDYSRWDHSRDFPKPERFEVVYNLMSLKHFSRLFVKVTAADGQKVPSVKDVFLGAEYPEREIWDLLGVVFEGNEQTQRFLLPDDWIGFPLRKEFPLGGEDVVFDQNTKGPAVEDMSAPLAGESFEGKTGSESVSGR